MGDHADHIHVGFQPLYGTNTKQAKQVNAILKPDQWIKLVDRLNEIDNPVVPTKPSKVALKAGRSARLSADDERSPSGCSASSSSSTPGRSVRTTAAT